MSFFHKTKPFEERFNDMLNSLNLNGQKRQSLLDLPQEKKELLVKSHELERKNQTFWRKIARKSSSAVALPKTVSPPTLNGPEIENQFLEIIAKAKNHSPNEMQELLRKSLAEKEEYIRKYHLEQNQELINETFLDLVGKMAVSPEKMSDLLKMSLEERDKWIKENAPKPVLVAVNLEDLVENSTSWFILKLANRNASLKTLFRTLQNLRVSMTGQGQEFIQDFLEKNVPTEERVLTGVSALEIALDRVYSPFQRDNGEKIVWYADQLLPDDVRLEVLKCIEVVAETDFGMDYITSSRLIKELVKCLSIPSTKEIRHEIITSSKNRATFLTVTTKLGALFGPALFIYRTLADQVISEIHELKRLQQEGLPFSYLVASLTDPFAFSTTLSNSLAEIQYLTEYWSIWQYRTALLMIFNGIISSSDELAERRRRRTIFERAGIRGVLRNLMLNNPTEEFSNQVLLFNNDRDEDNSENLKILKDRHVDMANTVKSLELTIDKIKVLHDADLLKWLLSRIIHNLYDIISGLDGERVLILQDINAIFSLIESTTCALSDSVKNYELQYTTESKIEWKTPFYDAALDFTGEQHQQLITRDSVTSLNIEEMSKEIQRLQVVVSAMNDEKNSRELFSRFNNELGSALKKRVDSNATSLDNVESSPLAADDSQPNLEPTNDTQKIDEIADLIIKAPTRMKALQWESIPLLTISPFWETIFYSAYQKNVGELLEEETLMELFSKPDNTKESSKFINLTAVTVRFLDDRLSRNIEIFLSASRKSADVIRDALISIDSGILNLDMISRLQRLLPLEDIVDQIQQYQGEPLQLGKAEYFILQLFSIPRIRSRLKCLAFYFRFSEEYAEIIPDVTIIRAATQEVLTSPIFAYILQIVLVSGNYLNRDTFRGNAHGFKIQSLNNLRSTVSNNSQANPTLLHFLCRTLANKKPTTIDFINTMPNVKSASFVSIKSLVEGVKELEMGLKFIHAELREPIISTPADEFRSKMEKFIGKSTKKMASLKEKISIMSKELNEMLVALGEEETLESSDSFFTQISLFAKDLQKCNTENQVYDLHQKGLYQSQSSLADSSTNVSGNDPDTEGPKAAIQLTKLVLNGNSLSMARKTIKKALGTGAV